MFVTPMKLMIVTIKLYKSYFVYYFNNPIIFEKLIKWLRLLVIIIVVENYLLRKYNSQYTTYTHHKNNQKQSVSLMMIFLFSLFFYSLCHLFSDCTTHERARQILRDRGVRTHCTHSSFFIRALASNTLSHTIARLCRS